MNIAFVHKRMDFKGGAENIIVWLGWALAEQGHQVTVITEAFNPDLWPPHFLRPINVQILPDPKGYRIIRTNRLRAILRSKQLCQHLAGVDLVIAQLYPVYWWMIEARKRSRHPWKAVWLCQEPQRKLYAKVTDAHLLNHRAHAPEGVQNPHLEKEAAYRLRENPFKRLKKALTAGTDRKMAGRCDVIMTNSRFTASNVEAIYGIQPDVCHLGIPLPPEQSYHPGDYIGVVTTLSAKKNVHNTIRAMDELVNKRGLGDVRLQILGRGPQRDALKQLAGELNLNGHVRFLGNLPDSALPDFYHKARCVVYCTIDEPFGLVPIEAMAAKTPLIASDHGGPVEVVGHQEAGLLVNPFHPGSIADAMAQLWRDPDMAKAFGLAGRQKAADYFSLDAFLDRFTGILSKRLALPAHAEHLVTS